jgi:hypothetical protein
LRLALIFSGGPLDATQTGCDRIECLGDVGRGFKGNRKCSEYLGIDLGSKILRQAASQLGFDFEDRLTHRAAEETVEYLIGRDRIAATRQGVRMCLA